MNETQKERYIRLLRNSNLQSPFKNLEFDSFKTCAEKNPEQYKTKQLVLKYAEKFHKPLKVKAESGSFLPTTIKAFKSLLFVGKNGTGKTHLASCLANGLMYHQGVNVLYVTAENIIQEMLEARNYKHPERPSDVYKKYDYPDLLIIDEIGAGSNADADLEAATLSRIFDNRLGNPNTTLLISNLNEQELTDRIGKRFGDRLKLCAVCRFTWESMRN